MQPCASNVNQTQKAKGRFPNTSIFLFIVIFLLDQATKYYFNAHLQYAHSYSLIPGLLNFTLIYNRGGAFGIGQAHPQVFVALTILTLGILIFIYRRLYRDVPGLSVPFVFVFSGALGNFFDRLRLGYVIDFIDFYISKFHWPAFNLADSAISVGIVLLIWKMWRHDTKEDQKN